MGNVIKVDNVGMCFRTSEHKITSFKEYIIKGIKREIKYNEFWALKDISFQINKGEVFGILGLNGAGKSTILKVISGILKPTEGQVAIGGSISPLIELGAGFDPELTAKENIYLNAAILGYSDKYIENVFDEIVEFSELKEFLDTPIKNFSSGMYARLGFAIATAVVPDILIIDEILAVGDFKFQEKCQEKIKKMMDSGATVVLVSHSIEQIRHMCTRGIILEKGKKIFEGEVNSLCDYYYERYN